MFLFKKTKPVEVGPKSKLLAETAANALSVFNSTISKLKEVVESAKEAITSNQKEIDSLQAENSALEKVVNENTAMANKLLDLFNPQPSSPSSDGGQ